MESIVRDWLSGMIDSENDCTSNIWILERKLKGRVVYRDNIATFEYILLTLIFKYEFSFMINETDTQNFTLLDEGQSERVTMEKSFLYHR